MFRNTPEFSPDNERDHVLGLKIYRPSEAEITSAQNREKSRQLRERISNTLTALRQRSLNTLFEQRAFALNSEELRLQAIGAELVKAIAELAKERSPMDFSLRITTQLGQYSVRRKLERGAVRELVHLDRMKLGDDTHTAFRILMPKKMLRHDDILLLEVPKITVTDFAAAREVAARILELPDLNRIRHGANLNSKCNDLLESDKTSPNLNYFFRGIMELMGLIALDQPQLAEKFRDYLEIVPLSTAPFGYYLTTCGPQNILQCFFTTQTHSGVRPTKVVSNVVDQFNLKNHSVSLADKPNLNPVGYYDPISLEALAPAYNVLLDNFRLLHLVPGSSQGDTVQKRDSLPQAEQRLAHITTSQSAHEV